MHALYLFILLIRTILLIITILLISLLIPALFGPKTDPIFPLYSQLHILLLKFSNFGPQLMHIIDILVLEQFPVMPQPLNLMRQYFRNLIQSLLSLLNILTAILQLFVDCWYFLSYVASQIDHNIGTGLFIAIVIVIVIVLVIEESIEWFPGLVYFGGVL